MLYTKIRLDGNANVKAFSFAKIFKSVVITLHKPMEHVAYEIVTITDRINGD